MFYCTHTLGCHKINIAKYIMNQLVIAYGPVDCFEPTQDRTCTKKEKKNQFIKKTKTNMINKLICNNNNSIITHTAPSSYTLHSFSVELCLCTDWNSLQEFAKRTYRNVMRKIVFSFDCTQKIPNFTCTTSAMQASQAEKQSFSFGTISGSTILLPRYTMF